jgi:hypothetical protein
LLDATATEKSFNKCLAEVSSTMPIRDKKADERWAMLLKRQEEKMDLKKCKEDFSMLTASTVGMDPRTLAAHSYYKVMILDEIDAKIAAAEAAATTLPPEAVLAPAGALASPAASATTGASTTASASTLASATAATSVSPTEHPDRAEHNEVVMLDGPASIQDVSSSSPNCFL